MSNNVKRGSNNHKKEQQKTQKGVVAHEKEH